MSDNHTHRRRVSTSSPTTRDLSPSHTFNGTGVTTAVPADRGRVEHLKAIPGTPRQMSLSRSPSPQFDGGWSTPGLTSAADAARGSVAKSYGRLNGTPAWAAAQTRSAQVNAYSSPAGRKNGFWRRNLRSLSASLPHFHIPVEKDYSNREKLGRGRWLARAQEIAILTGRVLWRLRIPLAILLLYILANILFYSTRKLGLETVARRLCANTTLQRSTNTIGGACTLEAAIDSPSYSGPILEAA